MLLPAVLVLPGLVAFARLGPHDILAVTPERTCLRLIDVVFSAEGFLGPLGRGLAVSAVVAAAMCVVGSVLNAAATLWSIDIAQDLLLRPVSEADMIRRGRWSSLAALLIGVAAAPLLLWWKQGVLVYIEEVAAVAMPPLAVVLAAAFFWPRVHGRVATVRCCWESRWAACSGRPPLRCRSRRRGSWPRSPCAAINALFCLAVLAAGTFLIPQSAYERYDADTAWSLGWGRLSTREQQEAGALGNVAFWWAVMVVAMIAAGLVFLLR